MGGGISSVSYTNDTNENILFDDKNIVRTCILDNPLVQFFESIGRSNLESISSAEYCISLGIYDIESFALEIIKDKKLLDYLQLNVDELDKLIKLNIFDNIDSSSSHINEYLSNNRNLTQIIESYSKDYFDMLNISRHILNYDRLNIAANHEILNAFPNLERLDNVSTNEREEYNSLNESVENYSMHGILDIDNRDYDMRHYIPINEENLSISPNNHNSLHNFPNVDENKSNEDDYQLFEEENQFNILSNDTTYLHRISYFDLDLSSARITFSSDLTVATRHDRIGSYYLSTFNPIAKAISKVTELYSQFTVSLDYFPVIQRSILDNTYFSIGFTTYSSHLDLNSLNNNGTDKGFGLTKRSWGMIYTTNIYSNSISNSIYHIYENGSLITEFSEFHLLNQFDYLSLKFDLNEGNCHLLVNQSLLYVFKSIPMYESYLVGVTLPNCYKISILNQQIGHRTDISTLDSNCRKSNSQSTNVPFIKSSNLEKPSVIEDEKYCCICMENLKNVVLLPCRHLCVCKYCSDEEKSEDLIECPLCRHKIEQKLLVYL